MNRLSGKEGISKFVRFFIGRWMFAGVLSITILGCGSKSAFEKTSESFGVDSMTERRFHEIPARPYGFGLMHHGYIIGIEKAPKRRVGYDHDACFGKRFLFHDTDGSGNAGSVPGTRAQKMENIIEFNAKAPFVSHIVEYRHDHGGYAYPTFHYNVYPDRTVRGVGVSEEDPKKLDCGYYEAGWKALEGPMTNRIMKDMQDALQDGVPYSHIIIGAMGWANDQIESMRRFNIIMGRMLADPGSVLDRPGEKFKPLFIGITWPSVWGGNDSTLREAGLKVASYVNKANDADEIGYTYANWLVNLLAQNMRAEYEEKGHELKVAVFGHSFGARMMSRAVFSRGVLREKASEKSQVTVNFGLQPAFSAKRFVKGSGNEGWPYAAFADQEVTTIVTSSEHDSANALAIWSRHMGGSHGLNYAREHSERSDNRYVFSVLDAKKVLEEEESYDREKMIEVCRSKDRVIVLDSSAYIDDHNDILSNAVADMFALSIECSE